MAPLMQSQIFFFISSIGFIIWGILVALVLLYVLHILNSFSKIIKKLEKDIDSVSDITKEMIEDVRDSNVFRFLFPRKRKHK